MNGDPTPLWSLTGSGKKFQFACVDPAQLDIEDIALGLSHLCRYTGQCHRFYSVAEHSVAMAEIVLRYCPDDRELAKWALFHDASEAYLNDIARPVKRQMPDAYRELEARIMTAVALRFELLPRECPEVIGMLDLCICYDEKRKLFPGWVADMDWGIPGEALGVSLPGWSSEDAERAFLEMWLRLCRPRLFKYDRRDLSGNREALWKMLSSKMTTNNSCPEGDADHVDSGDCQGLCEPSAGDTVSSC